MTRSSPQLEIRGIVKQHRRWPVILGITTVGIALGIAGGGFAYAYHYQDLVLPHTLVGKYAVGNMTPQELSQKLSENCQKIEVKFTGDISGSYKPTSLGLGCKVEETVKAVMAANEKLPELLASTMMERRVKPKYDFDEASAATVARQLVEGRPGAVSDPEVNFDAKTLKFNVFPGTPGLGIDPKDIKKAAINAWENQTNTTAKLKLAEVQPLTAPPQLEEWAKSANKLIQPRIRLSTRQKGQLMKPEQKAAWIEITAQGPRVSRNKVQDWLEKFTAAEINIPLEPGHRQLTADGKLFRLTKMGWDAKTVKNNAQLSAEITEALNAGKNYQGTFEFDVTPGTYTEEKLDVKLPVPPYSPKDDEIWTSVDLANHTLSAWKGHDLVMGPVAIVHGSKPSPTRAGIFHVQSKHTKAHMKRTAWDGPYDVWSPWTMYYSGDYAIHGTTSRRNWVQTDYGGSHGCVNMKPPEAKELFGLMKVGDTVVIHRAGEL